MSVMNRQWRSLETYFSDTQNLRTWEFHKNVNIGIEITVSSFEENILMRVESNAFPGKTEFG